MSTYTRSKGFSLIELMIVIAILGTLAAITIPSYQHYVTKARSAEVFSKFDYLKTATIEWKETSGAANFDNYGNTFSDQVTNQNFNWGWAEGNGVLFASYIPNTVVLLTFGGQVNSDGSITWACLASDIELSNCFNTWDEFATAVPDAASLD